MTATCPEGTRWDGTRCVLTTVHCPRDTDVVDGRCVARASTSTPAATSANPDVAVCQSYCGAARRGAARRCAARPRPRTSRCRRATVWPFSCECASAGANSSPPMTTAGWGAAGGCAEMQRCDTAQGAAP